MTVTLYVPRDSAALAVGAERVAQRIAAEALNGRSETGIKSGGR